MSAPYEIIEGPFEVWYAEVGTAFPVIDAAPAGDWAKLGTSGSKNITEEGVTVTFEQQVATDPFRMFGSTGPRKAARTAEDLLIAFTLADLSAEHVAIALNDGAVAATAAGTSTAGFRTIDLSRGLVVAEHALLIRGPSAYIAGHNSQFEIPRCFQNGNPAPVFVKGAPAGLAFEFKALEDDDDPAAGEEFGRLVIADAAATG